MKKYWKRFRLWLVLWIAPPIEAVAVGGHLGGPQSSRLMARKEIALEMQERMSAEEACRRCDLPSGLVMPHLLYIGNGEALFAICEDCHQELLYSHHRLPYYLEGIEENEVDVVTRTKLEEALDTEDFLWKQYTDLKYPMQEATNGKRV